tara:strand:+ start:17969 stop:18148 length:180 start_codon:yes stop_codon:yes gene_type:complete
MTQFIDSHHHVSPHVIKRLEEAFPNVMPPKGSTLEDIAHKQGSLHVVNFIKQLIEGGND